VALALGRGPPDPLWQWTREGVEAENLPLLREMVGNPFRPVAISPALRTPTVLALSQAAEENRTLPAGHLEPDRLAVLADAREDAGCTDPELLGHLRGRGPLWGDAMWSIPYSAGSSNRMAEWGCK